MTEATRRVALVTGGERGLGLEIARQLGAKGLEVFIGARDPHEAKAATDQIVAEGGVAHPIELDVRDQATVERLASTLRATSGRIDVLVNNAGVLLDGPDESALTASLDTVRQTLDTNLYGAWLVAMATLPLMRENGYGRVVNISSTMGQLETMGHNSPGYRLSKAALNALTCMLASEVRSENILVNAVEPGWTRTAMGGPDAPRSVAEGAATAVWLATLPDGSLTAGFFFDRRLIPW
jgi:NAD(P)-dependent dehydrogenase (short-subunit alcohol dehydrogenase family)